MKTPRLLKFLILFTAATSILTALIDRFFIPRLGFSLFEFLGLSLKGIQNFYLWQPITYLFLNESGAGITFSSLIHLAFNSYLLWIAGLTFFEKKQQLHFFFLYFLSGILSGLTAIFCQHLLGQSMIYTGNLAAIYALLLAWTALHPQAQFFFLLTLPLRIRYLIWIFFGIHILIDFSSGNWPSAAAYSLAGLFGYLYGMCLYTIAGAQKAAPPFRAKIYDFKTGKAILKDEEFLEAMLTKISLQGKKSLSWREKWRLRRIAKKRKKN
jgi:membrane associated rhomboid family serine protease